MHVVNKYFDNIFVISHPETERHRIFLKNWDGLKFSQGRFVNKYIEVSKEDNFATHVFKEFPKRIPLKDPLSNGQIACALAHMLIYKNIIDNNLENTLILEDDATFITDQNLEKVLKEEFDILQLWTINEFIREEIRPDTISITNVFRERASSYVIKNRIAAMELLMKQCNALDTADGAIIMADNLLFRAIIPSNCNITNGVSYIHDEIY